MLARKPAGPLLRAGGRRARSRAHRAPGRSGQGRSAARAEGARRRGVGRRRHLRRPDREGLRCRGHRACAAPPRSTWSGPSARTTWSTTRVDDFADGSHRYDVILDIGGNRRLSDLRRALDPARHPRDRRRRDRRTVARWLRPHTSGRHLLSPFVGQKLTMFASSENAEDLDVLRGLIDSGTGPSGDRPLLPAARDRGRDPAPPRRPRPRQDRGDGVRRLAGARVRAARSSARRTTGSAAAPKQ